MLRAIALRDFVIVDSLDLELAGGFTALTGETGAGKSILVDALGLALGGRADAGVIRAGAARADVSADFDLAGLPDARRWLAENDLEEGDTCLVRRTVDRAGRSRGFVNGRPATAAQLRALGERLVDIHGQHEHQWLAQRDYQRQLLDAYAQAEADARESARLHGLWREARSMCEARESAQASSEREREFLRQEISDLEALGFSAEGWAQEQAEHRRLAHSQELIAHVRSGLEDSDEAEESATTLLARAASRLAQAEQVDPILGGVARDLSAAHTLALEAAHELRRYLQDIEADPSRLEALDRRLRAVMDAARRLRIEPAFLPDALAQRRSRLAELGGDESLATLRERESAAREAFGAVAHALSERRSGAAHRLAQEVTKRLQGLAMEGGRFEVTLVPLAEPGAQGLEAVEFHVAAHAGQPAGPIGKVASGGELSRLALALQVILGARSGVATLVFDEVDAGIGGRVAEIVGQHLGELARHRQVLCVTHLPQVASLARTQLRVSKHGGEQGAVASVECLDGDGRVDEIARMLGGARITETTRRHAREMLAHAATLSLGPKRGGAR